LGHNKAPATALCALDIDLSVGFATIEAVPNGAKSLVLIIDDPDAPDPKAPKMVWVHWVVYNIPPDTKSLPENVGKARLPQSALLGLNDFKKTGYGGPCPPIGRHRYFHKLYALVSRSI
jgi:Raf kinase inhibitor-like YbhB/YbcL family protein